MGAISKQTLSLVEGWIVPQWSAPSSVFAYVTTRHGGVSKAPFNGLNLGLHVGDDAKDVHTNRARLSQCLPVDTPLQWLTQVHGTSVVDALGDGVTREADAAFIDKPGVGAVVMTADCLPVFFASKSGGRVAVAHAGWRGLLDGVLENTLSRFPDAADEVLVWLGPAIGQCHFEVGEEVRDAFVQASASGDAVAQAFQESEITGKFFADLYRLARQRLQSQGVRFISGGEYCTFCDDERFYSYRRENRTGRFASVIGLLS